MRKKMGPGPRRLRTGRLLFCSVAALATLAANWVAPPPLASAPVPPMPATRPHHSAHTPHPRPAAPASDRSGSPLAPSALSVMRWTFRSGDGEDVSATAHAPAGQSLTLSMTLDGNQAALDRMRTRGAIAIEVRWQRQSGSAGAPDLVTRLTIGHPGLADRLAGEVRRTGFFQWHSWAEKTSLSPGIWSISLTYPDGTPLACGNPPAPCRFRIAVG